MKAEFAAIAFASTLLFACQDGPYLCYWGCTEDDPRFCEDQGPCSENEYCDSNNTCTEFEAGECLMDSDCQPAGTCLTPNEMGRPGVCDRECVSSSGCAPDRPICAGGWCVSCTAHADACRTDYLDKPFCAADGRCVECVSTEDCQSSSSPDALCSPYGACDSSLCESHSACPESQACDLESRTCLPVERVIYVDGTNGTDTFACTKDVPCRTITRGLEFVGMTRDVVVLSDATYQGPLSVTLQQRVTLIGPAVLQTPTAETTAETTVEPVLSVSGSNGLRIHSLSISGAQSYRGSGVECDRARIQLWDVEISGNHTGINSNGCIITIQQSHIKDNDGIGIKVSWGTLVIERSDIGGNRGGGMQVVDTDFRIQNNFFVENGDTDSLVGGVYISNSSPIEQQTFEFNTVADNSSAAEPVGVACGTQTPMTAANNIVYGVKNKAAVDHERGCSWTYSNIEGAESDDENINVLPGFKGTGDFHLESDSPCIDVADPTAKLDVDFDGDARPSGDRADMGADEVVPSMSGRSPH